MLPCRTQADPSAIGTNGTTRRQQRQPIERVASPSDCAPTRHPVRPARAQGRSGPRRRCRARGTPGPPASSGPRARWRLPPACLVQEADDPTHAASPVIENQKGEDQFYWLGGPLSPTIVVLRSNHQGQRRRASRPVADCLKKGPAYACPPRMTISSPSSTDLKMTGSTTC